MLLFGNLQCYVAAAHTQIQSICMFHFPMKWILAQCSSLLCLDERIFLCLEFLLKAFKLPSLHFIWTQWIECRKGGRFRSSNQIDVLILCLLFLSPFITAPLNDCAHCTHNIWWAINLLSKYHYLTDLYIQSFILTVKYWEALKA